LDVSQRRWPEEGLARVPYWVYTDADLYAKEQERIFGGAHWNYVALACEVPEPGDFKRSFVGDKPVVVTRDATGVLRVFENRCAHRGVQFCREHLGNTKRFTCPYHQWSYDLDGSLVGVPFRRGVKGQGGMPEGFDRGEHALRTLAVAERNGVVFASFDDSVEPLDAYLGESMLGYFERVFDGRPLRVLGYQKQKIPANWKLMFENIKDPYHASLLHVFLVSFGLFRADQPSAVKMDATGRHAVLVSRKGEQKASEATEDIRNLRTDFVLNDPRLLDPVREFPGDATVVMQTLWPNVIVQQQSNTLAMRHIVPDGPGAFRLHWTFFGYAEDTEEMTTRRLRQANLMGVSGFVSADDSEVMKFSQEGLDPYADQAGVMEMGGTDVVDEEHMVTEAAIRAFYAHYRRVMDLG
jgi:salicylate 5-hydroxylase large subunit